MILAICLVVLLRALVPAGFMPDIAAMADGRLALTICHSSDLPLPDPDGTAPRPDDCPFAPFAQTSLAGPADRSDLMARRITQRGDGSRAPAQMAQSIASFLPLGARAPPLPLV